MMLNCLAPATADATGRRHWEFVAGSPQVRVANQAKYSLFMLTLYNTSYGKQVIVSKIG
ncbi:MAG: hypothetical protein R3C11_01485 [Planctomycetaceae bacterium]